MRLLRARRAEQCMLNAAFRCSLLPVVSARSKVVAAALVVRAVAAVRAVRAGDISRLHATSPSNESLTLYPELCHAGGGSWVRVLQPGFFLFGYFSCRSERAGWSPMFSNDTKGKASSRRRCLAFCIPDEVKPQVTLVVLAVSYNVLTSYISEETFIGSQFVEVFFQLSGC